MQKFIKVSRYLVASILVAMLVPLFFLFPFLFDSPKSDNPLYSLYLFAILASFPASFLFTGGQYQQSFAEGNRRRGIFLGFFPLAWFMSVAYLVFLDKLPKVPDLMANGLLIGQHGESLSLKPPPGCDNTFSHFRGPYRYAQYNGQWVTGKGEVHLDCALGNTSFLTITSTEHWKGSDDPSHKRVVLLPKHDIIENGKIFSVERYRIETTKPTGKSFSGHELEEVQFQADDQNSVTVTIHMDNAYTPNARRRLDNKFQMMYQVPQFGEGYTGLREADRQVTNYVRSTILGGL